MRDEFDSQVEALGILRDPVRRSLYRHVAGQPSEVSRDDAARAVGISRILAAFHLDRLVEAGLLDAIYRRLSGRSGPGAGRTSKLYRRANRQFRLILPERRYDLLAWVLVKALESQTPERASAPLAETAKEIGAELGQDAAAAGSGDGDEQQLLDAGLRRLDQLGFEPIHDGPAITLRNCPFDTLAKQHRDLVCGVNLSLLHGFLAGLGTPGTEARLDPAAGRCCVRLQPVAVGAQENASRANAGSQ